MKQGLKRFLITHIVACLFIQGVGIPTSLGASAEDLFRNYPGVENSNMTREEKQDYYKAMLEVKKLGAKGLLGKPQEELDVALNENTLVEAFCYNVNREEQLLLLVLRYTKKRTNRSGEAIFSSTRMVKVTQDYCCSTY